MGGLCSSAGGHPVDRELMRDMFGHSETTPNKKKPITSNEGATSPRKKNRTGGPVRIAFGEFWQMFEMVRHISNSPYGSMDIVRSTDTWKEYAAKHVSKRQAMAGIADVRVETQVLKHLAGDGHIVQLLESYEDDEATHLVMELCSGGDILSRIAGTYRAQYKDEKSAADNFRQVVEAVDHLHHKGVMHRDIKPENFIFSDGTDAGVLKLSDFGLACFFTRDTQLTDFVGSPQFVAPEVLTRSYNKEADVWSCGVILYMMLSGRAPFTGTSIQEVISAVTLDSVDVSSHPWREVSKPARHLVRKMLCKEPKHRISMDDVLSHPWLRRDGVADNRPIVKGVADSMLKMQNLNKFTKEARKFLGTNLSPADVQSLKVVFKKLDSDRDGRLNMPEVQEGLFLMGELLPAAGIEALMSQADLVGGGDYLDIGELVGATLAISRMTRNERLHEVFVQVDKDKDGIISVSELKEALRRAAVKDVDALLSQVDEKLQGRFNFMVFCALMRDEKEKVDEKEDEVLLLIPEPKQDPEERKAIKARIKLDSTPSSRDLMIDSVQD